VLIGEGVTGAESTTAARRVSCGWASVRVSVTHAPVSFSVLGFPGFAHPGIAPQTRASGQPSPKFLSMKGRCEALRDIFPADSTGNRFFSRLHAIAVEVYIASASMTNRSDLNRVQGELARLGCSQPFKSNWQTFGPIPSPESNWLPWPWCGLWRAPVRQRGSASELKGATYASVAQKRA
jgi:hypothetical protein